MAMPTSVERPALTLALLVALPLLVLWRPLALGETFYQEDLAAQYFPRERLLQQSGFHGWNPHEFMGMGLAADPQTAPFEPVRALARRLGLAERLGLVLYVGVYLAIATCGTWALARRFRASTGGAALAVLAFVWGGTFIVRFRHPWMFASMALIPWAAWGADRLAAGGRLRDAIAIGVVNAWGALGGHPQVAYMTWLFALVLVTVQSWGTGPPAARLRRLGARWLRLGAAAALFCGLLAGFYQPVLSHLLGSARGAGARLAFNRLAFDRLAFAATFSFNPWDWLRLLAPDLYGNDLAGTHFGTRNYHEQTCYLGIAPLTLFVLQLGWRERLDDQRGRRLAALALGFFALAAGRYLPPFYVCYALVPGFRLFRCACRYSWFFSLLASAVAGLTLTRIARGERPRAPLQLRRWLGRLLAGLALACALAAAAALLWRRMDRHTQPGAHLTTAWAAARAAAFLLAARALLRAWLNGRLAGPTVARGLVVLTCLDLAVQWLPYRQSRPPREVLPDPAVIAALAGAAPGRVLVRAFNKRGEPEIVPLANWGEAAGYDDLRGYNQLAPPDTLELLARADLAGRPLTLPDALGGFDPADWLLDLAGVTRIAARTGEWPARWQQLPLEAEGGGWQVRRRRGALPRAWLVGAVARCSDAEARARLPGIDPRRLAFVDPGAAPELPELSEAAATGSAQLVALSPDEVQLQLEATRPALVILSDRFDPGWAVEVDGLSRKLLRADGIFRAVEVTAGRHQVRFRYRPPGRAGWWLTAATLALMVIAALVLAARNLSAVVLAGPMARRGLRRPS
jgi:hypothetical protein